MTALATNVTTRFSQAITASIQGLPRPFWFLWGGTLLNRIGSFVLPMMTMYLTKGRGLSLDQAGWVISVYGLGSVLAMQLGGLMTDHLGRRKTMLLSLCLSGCSMLGLGFASNHPQLLLAGFALGFTGDLYRPASMALLNDVVPAVDRMRAFGLLYWAINLGFSIAALAGGQLAHRVGFQALFFIDAASTFTWAFILYRNIPETRPEPVAGDKPSGSLLTPLFDAPFSLFLLTHLALTLVFFQFQVALPADMTKKGLTESDFGIAMSLNGVLIVILQPFATRLLQTTARSRVLALSALLYGFGYGANAFAHSLPTYMAAVALWTIGEIIMAPTGASIVADLSPADMRGRYQGAYGLTWSLGVMATPILSALLIARTSVNVLWATCVGIGIISAVGHLLLGPMRRRRMQALGVDLLGRSD